MAIKFVDAMKARTQQGQLTAQDQDMLDEVTPVIQEHNLLLTKLIQLPYVTLTNLEQRAATYSGKAQPDLGGMMVVHFPGSADELTVANDLLALDAVEYVINELLDIRLHDDIPPTTPLLWGNQGYFGPDPGLDMDYSWSKASIGGLFNTRAKGIKLTQVEAAWRLEHEDLVDQGVVEVSESEPNVPDVVIYHGTAVLGILGADENAYGVTGQASEATLQVAGRTSSASYLDALAAAILNSAQGDVISISAGIYFLGPMEVDFDAYLLIMMAVDSGITVAMSAGNDDLDLDKSGNGTIEDWLALDDSGSIIVGAGTADTLHQRLDFSNYGARVNVQSWGENVFTLGCSGAPGTSCFEYGGDPNQRYSDFGGTSAASPMIASACASLQGFHKDRFGVFMAPSVLRQLLIDTGIPQGGADPESEHIGPFPNMRAAIDDLLGDPSVPLPFFDDFPRTTINVVNWPLGDGVIDDQGDGEPSAPYSLHLGPGQTLESASMVTTDACTVDSIIQLELIFWAQDSLVNPPDPGGDLAVQYRDGAGVWKPLASVPEDNQVDEYDLVIANPPTSDALHDAFRIRFESQATVGDWFVDDVSITILTEPVFRLTPLTQVVCAGDSVELEVIATGGDLAYQWKKDGTDIPGETQSTYSIPVVGLTDEGQYTVLVSNDCNPAGIESAGGDLTVHERTELGAITLDPPGQPVDCGVSVTLSATVTGTPAPVLQWYFGDLRMPILGAMSDTLVIDPVVPSDEGDYILQATNALACQVGEDDDLVETVPFFLDVDQNDPTCLGGAPSIKSALSPQDHGGQTLYIGIVLDHGAGEPTTESRLGGVHTLEIMFDQAMDSATTEDTKNISVIGVNSGTIASVDMLATLDVPNGTLLTLTFPGLTGGRLANQDRYTIELSTLMESAGPGGLALAGDRDFDVRGLEADVSGNGNVDPLDSGAILARFALPVAMNVRYDINTSGAIDPLDSGAALARFGSSAP